MVRMLICAIVATMTTYGCWVWSERQMHAARVRRDQPKRLRRAHAGLHVGWTGLMTLLVWAGFMDNVRLLGEYPFGRLAVSLLAGAALVGCGAFCSVLWWSARARDGASRPPLWMRLNPIGQQMLFSLFSGAAFHHSAWGGPP
jgi:hypothetical protein